MFVLFLDSVKWGGVCVGGGGGGGLGIVYIQNISLECKIFNSRDLFFFLFSTPPP